MRKRGWRDVIRTLTSERSSPISPEFVALPDDLAARRKTGFFPGSTLGNLAPKAARNLLHGFGRVLGEEGRLIIGIDLKKDRGRSSTPITMPRA